MRALEKRPEDRYQSAEEMSHDLEEFLEESGLRSGNRRMALYMQELFAPDAATSDAGVAASRSFAEARPQAPGVPAAAPDDDSEELDLDRRAPLAMRIEVAPEPGCPPPAAARPDRVARRMTRRARQRERVAVAAGRRSAGFRKSGQRVRGRTGTATRAKRHARRAG